MKVYMAICNDGDPDIEGPGKDSILGLFSTKKKAIAAFERVVQKFDQTGMEYELSHYCYSRLHRIEEYTVDDWAPYGLDIKAEGVESGIST